MKASPHYMTDLYRETQAILAKRPDLGVDAAQRLAEHQLRLRYDAQAGPSLPQMEPPALELRFNP
jgi:hypothetical protein